MKKILFCIVILILSKAAFPLSAHAQVPKIEFDKIWVDFDVYENDLKGMSIHLKFVAKNMKDNSGYININICDTLDGFPLLVKDVDSKYANLSMQLQVSSKITPAFDPAYYDDLKLFLPYNELGSLSKGTYVLGILVYSEIDDGYSFIPERQLLTRYYFTYKQN